MKYQRNYNLWLLHQTGSTKRMAGMMQALSSVFQQWFEAPLLLLIYLEFIHSICTGM